MYYVALFEYSEHGNALSDEKEARDDGLAIFQAIVKAKDISSAEKKFREMLLRLHNESEIFYDVEEIYLQSIAEMNAIPDHATPLQWMSVRLFETIIPRCPPFYMMKLVGISVFTTLKTTTRMKREWPG